MANGMKQGLSRREFAKDCGVAAVAALLPGAAQAHGIFTPEQFGAKGDGMTNDTAAFVLLSVAVNTANGGTIELRQSATYVVGEQTGPREPPPDGWGRLGLPVPDFCYIPSPIIYLQNITSPVTINGNGATMFCPPGLRYGSFDPLTGQPFHPKLPFTMDNYIASPYEGMIQVEACTGKITVNDLILNGNLSSLIIGGCWGDTGIQIGASGLFCNHSNNGPTVVSNVQSVSHGLDGWLLCGNCTTANSTICPVEAHYFVADGNGRQGLSLCGSRSAHFEYCKFNNSGQGAHFSWPGAGVDIEPDVYGDTIYVVRNAIFVNCEAINNKGVGLLSSVGDVSDISWLEGTLVGTDNWALWPGQPGFVVKNSTVVGPVVNAYNGPLGPSLSASDTLFTNDPSYSPNGIVFGHTWLIDFGGVGGSPTFRNCTFIAVDGVGWYYDYVVGGGGSFTACKFTQYLAAAGSVASPRVVAYAAMFCNTTFYGRNELTGAAVFDLTNFAGTTHVTGPDYPCNFTLVFDSNDTFSDNFYYRFDPSQPFTRGVPPLTGG